MLLVQIRPVSFVGNPQLSFFVGNMEEPGKERDSEIDRAVEEYEEEEENGAVSHPQLPNKYLAELNMLLVSLSLFSFSMDECIEYEERQQSVRDHQVAEAKTCIQTKRGEIHKPKLARRSSSPRFQTTIRDFRHGRKM